MPARDLGATSSLQLQPQKPDVVFNALHGRFGEDGNIQGVAQSAEDPYTHSGLMASSLAMDKTVAKRLFEHAGLRVPEGKLLQPRRGDGRRSDAASLCGEAL